MVGIFHSRETSNIAPRQSVNCAMDGVVCALCNYERFTKLQRKQMLAEARARPYYLSYQTIFMQKIMRYNRDYMATR